MDALSSLLPRYGAALKYRYSERVGLADTISVRIDPQRLPELLADWPELVAQPAVLRDLADCGDTVCSFDEAPKENRTSTCSYDCGLPPPRALRGELLNCPQCDTVHAAELWPQARGRGVQVCVIDSGYDLGKASKHPDLPQHIVGGYSFPDHSPDFVSTSIHGTHVAGIIAAPENGIGTVGIAADADLRIYNVFSSRYGHLAATDADVIAALDAAIKDGCQIVNMSFGGGPSELEHQAIKRAYAAGLLLIASAGNAEDATHGLIRTARYYPAAYPEVVAVGATTIYDEIATFSSTGPSVALTAPGVAIYSSVPVGSGDVEVGLYCRFESGGAFELAAYAPAGGSNTPIYGVSLRDCGFGSLEETAACAPLGHLALIERGPAAGPKPAVPFAQKIHNARLQGAVGILLYNHRAGDLAQAGGLLIDIDIGGAVPVPVATLAAGDGEFLRDRLRSGQKLRCSQVLRSTSWTNLDGTSMAAPVVSGVAALLWSAAPLAGLSNVALRQLLLESAVDLGAPGRDDTFGAGEVDAAQALSQAVPRARCGDGRIDRGSEICDGVAVDGADCQDFGFDDVLGSAVVCNAQCSGLDAGGCGCAPNRQPFSLRLSLLHDYIQAGRPGTLAFYHVFLNDRPVRGAYARVSLRIAGQTVLQKTLGPSGMDGSIAHFLPEQGNGLPAGSYEVIAVITKGNGQCRDDQTLPPFRVVLRN